VSKGKLLAIVIVWLVVFGVGAVTWKWFLRPRQQQAQQRAREERLDVGTSASRYRQQLVLALDSFSGYAILRSAAFREELAKQQIRVQLRDDGADYAARIRGLQSGEVQMAAFTVDTLIASSAGLGDLPATAVAIVDETRGADAIVAYRDLIGTIDDLNRSDLKFVLTPNSPSETLARVVTTQFHLGNLAADPFVRTKDAAEVYQIYADAKPAEPLAYVLWEPYVSKILENEKMHVVVDSSRFHGYIVDVLVVSRDYLAKHEPIVRQVVACYFRAAYQHRTKLAELVLADARQTGQPLTQAQAEKLTDGIWWKNTQENMAHFGLRPGLQHIEDMMANVTQVLVKSHAIPADPTSGQPNRLYYDKVLSSLQQENFHPGAADEEIRDDIIRLPSLTAAQWEQLAPVGTLDVEPLVFARGTSTLTESSKRVLDDLAQKLKSSRYYVLIRGNASRRGNLAANQDLANQRAEVAAQHLIGKGIDQDRVRAVAAEPSGETSVTFHLGEIPY
jgi:outer membrane protein OmpA-like peptidoglycan-associated protein